MAMAQVTDNPDQDAKQQLHSYLRNNIQPLMQTGNPLDLKEIMHRVTISSLLFTLGKAKKTSGETQGNQLGFKIC